MRPVEKGTFCRIAEDTRTAMKGTKNYEREGNLNNYSYHQDIHMADTDILYVVDDNAFDKKGLFRVVPITFFDDGYWMEKAFKCATKKKSFLIDVSKLSIISTDIKHEQTVVDSHDNRLRNVINEINSKFNLHSKVIPIPWDGK